MEDLRWGTGEWVWVTSPTFWQPIGYRITLQIKYKKGNPNSFALSFHLQWGTCGKGCERAQPAKPHIVYRGSIWYWSLYLLLLLGWSIESMPICCIFRVATRAQNFTHGLGRGWSQITRPPGLFCITYLEGEQGRSGPKLSRSGKITQGMGLAPFTYVPPPTSSKRASVESRRSDKC